MDAGFAKALELFPELQEKIGWHTGVMGAWTEITCALEMCYRWPFPNPDSPVPNDEFIERVFAFSDWCFAAPRSNAEDDPYTAVIIGFFEDLGTHRAVRDDLPRWLRYSQVAALRSVFEYHLSKADVNALLVHMADNARLYRQRPRIESELISADGVWKCALKEEPPPQAPEDNAPGPDQGPTLWDQ